MHGNPYYQDEFVQLWLGDCLSVLREMESESVHCCVTSPPYYGLRNYSSEPTIWAGEADHQHEWLEHITPAANGLVNNVMQGESLSENSATRKPRKSDFCACGAWNGCLGLEPHPSLYIQNLTAIFMECFRLLRKDGLLFLNLGDSYAGSGRGWNIGDSKQTSNAGSVLLSRKIHEKALERAQIESGAIGNAWVKPPAGFKRKELMFMPHRVAIALSEAGFYARSDMPWVKRSAMPESVTDRPSKSLEYFFMFSKSVKYFCDMEAVRVKGSGHLPGNKSHKHTTAYENGQEEHRTKAGLVAYAQRQRDRSLPTNRNGITGSLDATEAGSRNFRNSDLWYSSVREPHGLVGVGNELVGLDVNPSGFNEAHFATYSQKLIEPLIKMGSREGDTILDPFAGSGTTLIVAKKLGRQAVGIELSPDYCAMAGKRIEAETAMPLFDAPNN